MTVNVSEAIKQLILDILGNRQTALQFVGDPAGELAARGLTDADLSNVDVNGYAREVCGGPGVPGNVQTAVQNHTSHSTQPPAHSAEQVVQQIQQITYVAYEGDETIINEIVQNNNNINVGDNFQGDIDVDNVTADDGAVANSGDGDVNAATGDEAQAIQGDNFSGQANTGDGAILNTGSIDGPINTGVNTGILADGDVTNAVVGDNNQTAQVEGSADDAIFNFGAGNVTQANDNQVDGAFALGGNATNVENSTLTGSAVSGEGPASGSYSYEDNDTTNTTTTTTSSVDNSIDSTYTDSFNVDTETNTSSVVSTGDVNTEQGDGDQDIDEGVVPV